MLAHTGSHPLIDPAAAVAILVLAVVVVAYTLGAARLRHSDRRGWPLSRIVSFWTGALLLSCALVPAWLPFDEGEFHQHMLQHLMLGMFAPLALVLGAPLTVLYRTQSVPRVRRMARLLRRPWLRVLGHPGVLVVLIVGGLVALYFTPLYRLAEANELLHNVVHLHFFISGYLFAWVIAGADPAPHRPSVPTRLVWIGVAILGHAVVAQLLYGGIWTRVPVLVADRRAAGDLMYFGGDIAELLLALAVVTTWHPRPARRSGSVVGEQLRPLPPWQRREVPRGNIPTGVSVEIVGGTLKVPGQQRTRHDNHHQGRRPGDFPA